MFSVLSLLVFASAAAASHVACANAGSNPFEQGPGSWYEWCKGQKLMVNGRVEYWCHNSRVADYGVIAPGTLELATPCGRGGYGPEVCQEHWVIEVQYANGATNYYWLYHKDDCFVKSDEIPMSVTPHGSAGKIKASAK